MRSKVCSQNTSDVHYPSHAQPLPLWHVLFRAMQLSPQAFPLLQTLQQLAYPDAAYADEDAHVSVAGPPASNAAAISIIDFILASPPAGAASNETSISDRS